MIWNPLIEVVNSLSKPCRITSLANISSTQLELGGQNEPHILDLVLTNDEIIDDIEYLSPLGKSDHAVLFFNF